MRQTLLAVSKFCKRVVDTLPLPQVYIPELTEIANIRHLSVRKIINMKGKNNGAVIALRNIINAKNWINLCVSLVPYRYGWYGICKIGESTIKRDLIYKNVINGTLRRCFDRNSYTLHRLYCLNLQINL